MIIHCITYVCSFEALVQMKEIEAPKVKLDRKPDPALAGGEPPKKEASTLLQDESMKDYLPVLSEPSSVEPASQFKPTETQPPDRVRKQEVTSAPPEVILEPRKPPPHEVSQAESVRNVEPSPKPAELPQADKKQVPPKCEPTPKISEPALDHKKEGHPKKGIIKSSY